MYSKYYELKRFRNINLLIYSDVQNVYLFKAIEKALWYVLLRRYRYIEGQLEYYFSF